MSAVGNQLGPVNFSLPGIANVGNPAIIPGPPRTSFVSAPSGDVQLGGVGVSVDPAYTKANQSAANMLAEISMAVTNPNEKKSVNDIMAELMIMMVKHSLANKNVEREMRVEIAQIQYKNGMK
ncbi:MAG: hypothetical protein LBI77_02390, partial [Puniceicoccales bacterium]|nr:hypothetical protein [Puniceicoccales bacterium]